MSTTSLCAAVLLLGFFCCASSQNYGLNSRARRVAKADYNIDVLVVVDYALYRKWVAIAGSDAEAKVKEYVAYLFKGVDQQYSTITTLDYNIRVYVSHIIVAKTANDSQWTESVKNTTGSTWVQADDVLKELEKYVKEKNATIPPHDHLMLLTGYDLIGRDASTSGYAGVKTVCTTNGLSVSVIEDKGPSITEATAVHELGHSLGAEHDGTKNGCKANDRYIMAPGGGDPDVSVTNLLNPWQFSTCSVKYFDDNLKALKREGLEASCLLKKLPETGVPTVPAQLPADPDEQCRQAYGRESYLCREYVPEPSDVCLTMRCFNPAHANRTCSLMPAATGTCCGKGKWCRQGRCEPVPQSSGSKCKDMSEVCPFGDQPKPLVQGGKEINCTQLPTPNCYEPAVRLKCCQRCRQARINKPSCEYGDRSINCDSTYCSTTTSTAPKEYDLECCGTCNASKPVDPNCSDKAGIIHVRLENAKGEVTEEITGKSCHEVLLEPSKKRLCCLSGFLDMCCHSCRERQSTSESCPFGDCSIGCASLKAQRRPCSEQNKRQCCQTCKEIESALTTTASPTVTATAFPPVSNPLSTKQPQTGTGTEKPCGGVGQPTCGACLLAANLPFVVALTSLTSCLWLLATSW